MKRNWVKLNYAVHPGEILKEYLIDSEMSQIELANKIGMNKVMLNEIIKGKRPITPKTAIKLEKAFSFAAQFWINLQMIYDEAVERLKIKIKESSSSINAIIGVNKRDESFYIVKKDRGNILVEWNFCAA